MRIKNVFCIGMIGLCLVGCGPYKNNATVTKNTGSALKSSETENVEEAEVEIVEDYTDLFVVDSIDMTAETITVYSVEENRQLRYCYNMTTKFLDKYGNSSSWVNFSPGTVVTLGSKLPSSGAISQVKRTDAVWEYDNLQKYSIDVEKNMFTMGGSNYKILPSTRVYSDDTLISFDDISENDILNVVGQDREIISVAVTTGHGYIHLTNTELFNNSLIFIGNKIVTMVYGENTIEIPEGNYKVTVANDGWGGSAQYEVVRNETTEINLDELKGEGPSFCEVSFLVTVPETYVYLDGKLVDTSEAIQVRYGTHKLTVNCNGYNSWNKKLIVNSESATITLEMEASTVADSNNTASASTDAETQNQNTNTTENSTNNSSNTTSNNSTNTGETYDYETDYLSTLSDLLSSILN